MFQMISSSQNVFAQTSRQAVFAISLALTALLGLGYHLIVEGPSSMAWKLFLLVLAVGAVSVGTDELRQREGEDLQPIVATIAQRMGCIQAALGLGLLSLAFL